MARDSSGTFTLYTPGNPVISGDVITAAWANPTLGDIAVELQDSLSRSGKGGMLAPLYATQGSVSLPSLSFSAEPSSGFYLKQTNDVRLSLGGTDRALFGVGGVSASSFAVTGNNVPAAGIYSPTASTYLGFASGGAARGQISDIGTWSLFAVDSGTGPTLSVGAISGAPGVRITSAGGDNARLSLVATGIREWYTVAANDGSYRVSDLTGGLDNLIIGTDRSVKIWAAIGGTNDFRSVATHDSGTFTGTLSGISGSPSGPFSWKRTGNWMTIYIVTPLTGTSNATTMQLTGLPAVCVPVAQVNGFCANVMDNGAYKGGQFQIAAASATVTFYLGFDGATSFTNTGTKGLQTGWFISYPLT